MLKLNQSYNTILARLFWLIILSALLIPSPASYAARGANLGIFSRDTITISLAISPSILIETVSDIRLEFSDRNTAASFFSPFCIRGVTSTNYTILALGSYETDDSFLLTNSDGEELSDAVSYRGELETEDFDILFPGKPSPIYKAIDSDTSCADGGAVFEVNFRSEDLQAATSGDFSGALILLVSPE